MSDKFSKEKYGEFDVILCCGILYHLREHDAIRLVHRIYDACRAFVILDTQFSVAPKVTVAHDDKTYAGRIYREHYPNKSPAAIAEDVYASLDNMESFWFTVPSLLNLFADAGFSSVTRSQTRKRMISTTELLSWQCAMSERTYWHSLN